jgi:long-chain acyl-CoA synthetase
MHYAPKVHSLILKDLQTAGMRSGLAGMEIVSDIVITDEEWTPLSVSLKHLDLYRCSH